MYTNIFFFKISNATSPIITIGDGTISYLSLLNKSFANKPLKAASEYCVTFTLISHHENSEDVVVYHEKNLFTEPSVWTSPQKKENEEEPTSIAAYLVPTLFLLLLLASGAWLTYRYVKKKITNVIM